MWRKRRRARDELAPFPDPVATIDGVERFASCEIVSWLERTGRGVNPEFRDDALAHSDLPDFGLDLDTSLRGASALLALKACTGRQLRATTPDDILDLADAQDPDNQTLYAEIEALGSSVSDVAGFVDLLTDAAYDVVGAGRRIDRMWRARSGRTGELADQALDLGGTLIADFALDRATDSVLIADPDGLAQPLVARALARLDERIGITVTVGGSADQARWSRRRLLIERADIASGVLGPDLPALGVVNVVACGGSAVDTLTRIDDAHLEFTSTQPVIVIGPAALLCDPLVDAEARRLRDDTFVRGGLRCAIRLPAGLRSDNPRTRLGVWVLTGPQTRVPVGERWFAAGDVTDRELSKDIIEAIVTDALASVSGQLARTRAFAALRVMRTADVLAEGAGLVPIAAAPHQQRVADPAADIIRMRAEHAALLIPRPSMIGAIRIDPATGETAETLPLERLVDQGDVRLIRGARIAIDRLRDEGIVRVFTASDVAMRRPEPARGLGALELATDYPHAQRTEPGDVVFTNSPSPAAVVDRDGGSVACSPARILRVHPNSGLAPHALAAQISSLRAADNNWRGWLVTRSSREAAARLDDVLQALEDDRAAAVDRAARIEGLISQFAAAQGLVATSLDASLLSEMRNITQSVTMCNAERGLS